MNTLEAGPEVGQVAGAEVEQEWRPGVRQEAGVVTYIQYWNNTDRLTLAMRWILYIMKLIQGVNNIRIHWCMQYITIL